MSAKQRRAGNESAGFYFEIFLVALGIILLEISFTRIFSFKVFYYFTYLIIGIALLGLGSGGVFVAIFDRLKHARADRLVPLLCSLAGAVVPLSYGVVAYVQLNVSKLMSSPSVEVPKLFALCAAMFVPFLLGGIVIASIFAARPTRISRLYFADLLGAGLGCAAVIFLLTWLTPPGTTLLAGLLFALAALPLAARHWRALLPLPVGVGLTICVLLAAPDAIPEPVADQGKAMAPGQLAMEGVDILHSEWNPVFRVDVKRVSGGPMGSQDLLVHDGIVGSSITYWDGDAAKLPLVFDSRSPVLPFSVVGDDPSVLVLGAAGGRQLLAALYFGAAQVTGVELNPVTVRLMKEKFADETRAFIRHERVALVQGEGRNFVSQTNRSYDLIWLVAPDTYAAMNAATAGAFVLSESYLYTVEMMLDAFEKLTPRGVVCAQFGDIDFASRPKRTARYLATARAALARIGVQDFEKHVLVATAPSYPWPASTILVRPEPFTTEEIDSFKQAVAGLSQKKLAEGTPTSAPRLGLRERAIVWHAGTTGPGLNGKHPVNMVISLPELALSDWLEGVVYDVSPVYDDSPFFWHFVRFRDAFQREWGRAEPVWDPEEATGERTLIVLLAVSVVFAAVMILLPFVAIRETWRALPHKTGALLYFTSLGVGFMFFEVTLIQQLTRFLGYPTYSLSVTLFAILISTGLGSFLSERYAASRNRAVLVLFAALVGLTLWYQFGMASVVTALSGLPLLARAAVATLLVAPLGLVLGAFMPLGLAAVAATTEHEREYIAWGWAVNGFASVVASVLATVLSMELGFRGVQLAALSIYGIGVLAFRRLEPR